MTTSDQPDPDVTYAQSLARHECLLLRNKLERIDRELIRLLAERTALQAKLMPASFPGDEPYADQVLAAINRRRAWAVKLGLDRAFAEVLFSVLFACDQASDGERRLLAATTQPGGGTPRAELPSAPST